MSNPSKIADLSGRTVEIIRKAKYQSRVRYLGEPADFLVKTEALLNVRVKPELLQEPVEKPPVEVASTEPVAPPELPTETQGLPCPPVTGPVTTKEIEDFHKSCQEIVDEYKRENFPTQYVRLDLSEGRRYFKLTACSGMVGQEPGDEASKSAWCFVDKDNGDVLKPADWRKPAKHARGNLRDEKHGLEYMGPYGPAYLR